MKCLRCFGNTFIFSDSSDPDLEVPIQEQIIILHYLTAGTAAGVTGQWVAYREIPGASFYYSAFVKRAIDPLKKVFGQDTAGLRAAGNRLGAKTVEAGDAGLEFDVFPRVPLQVILWEGDDEFEPRVTVLLDRPIENVLAADAIWALINRVTTSLLEGAGKIE